MKFQMKTWDRAFAMLICVRKLDKKNHWYVTNELGGWTLARR